MTNIVPGAVWRPIDVGNRAARRKGRGVVGHVAVSGSHCLVPSGTPAARNADWHFYLPKNPDPAGRFFQFIDLDVQCWASADGNASLAAWESEGGLGTYSQVNAEPWTDNQIESAAIILAYLNQTEGVPMRAMASSLPTERGQGTHRLGIDPWRVTGGESWSSNYGKQCPGNAKVGQVPAIVARAIEIRTGTPTPGDDMTDAERAQLQRIEDILMRRQNGGVQDVLNTANATLNAVRALANPATIAAELVKLLPTGSGGGLSEADVEAALRKVLGSLDTPAA